MARRRPHREVYIKEVVDDGVRVAIEGIVVDFDPERGGKVDDGTGVINVVLENLLFAEDVRVGSFVRLLGRAYISSEGRILRADYVHPLDVDPALYREIKELERRVYHEGGL